MNCIRIRAYQAVYDRASCLKFAAGHLSVLEVFGITCISSANHGWMDNPDVFVIQAESLSGDRVFGGARIHILNDFQPLPVETALYNYDQNIRKFVMGEPYSTTGEICGLWNSREAARKGIRAIYFIRTALALIQQIPLNTIFALCAAHTVPMARAVGFDIATAIGNEGTFHYPKDDLIATVMAHKSPKTLDTAMPEEKEQIFKLRNDPGMVLADCSGNGQVEILYDLDMSQFNRAEKCLDSFT